ncbi:NTPase KAP family P-loop domain-containing protein 1 isoform X1 [Scophthalmus maximus]|uniref:NTPase KAP family P-loop domain-containing protein 1 isoform X1 n=2 Tax=Scophthalmus maximus TaxID=52904 RepID=UPI001FA9220C|nr:NTPase KAP family P-loop domain-containing protein 1 isoform X1 [Scophthalmus maximus]XP_047187656.1 NTPase KAP family P-loop domain-containing protein 1 isoform X1 [Scophthalmus maximus]
MKGEGRSQQHTYTGQKKVFSGKGCTSRHAAIMMNPTKDDIHAYALSKTLTKVSSPATVGLYSPCQNRINMILGQMEVHMDEEAVKIEGEHGGRPRSVKPSLTGFVALIGRLLFYRPIWTKTNQRHHNIRFIYVHFSAWHFAGSDLLWAGIVIRLIQAMQMNFGKLQLALYRVVQHDEEEEITKKKVGNGTNNWRSRKICCCPLWSLVLAFLVVPIILLVFLLAFGLPKPVVKPGGQGDKTNGQVGMLEGLIIASLGVPAASALRFTFLMVKNLIFNQDKNMKKGMDNERVSSQLGFMNEVRKEMWFLSRFVQFMEIFERRRIRVVLKITSLDRCAPKKIVAVLEAINILLSDEESPFISILAVNPDVLVQKVNFADGCLSKEDRAYALLNRIVTLAFTLPPLSDDSKHSLYYSLTSNSKFLEDISIGKDKHRTGNAKKTSSSSDVTKVLIALEESNPLTNKTTAALDVNEEEVEKLVGSILTHNERNINQYMSDDAMSMRRVINSIRVTVIIMMALEKQLPEPDCIAAWVVLATRWPCRLSWIIQCAEDAQQRGDIDRRSAAVTDDSKTLWEVFSESKAELYVMSEQIEDLLEQDGDPEMFERFLTADFRFTLKDLKTFEVVTVNLDHTIRKELAQIRGTSRLKDSGWVRDLAPLHITTIINMDTEEVCKELERMKFPSKYIEKVKSNDLNGLALLFGNTDDLKELLGMTFGEWATFRLHFLGLPSHLRSQYKNLPLASSHPQNQLLRFKTHMSHHYSSNSSLVSNPM